MFSRPVASVDVSGSAVLVVLVVLVVVVEVVVVVGSDVVGTGVWVGIDVDGIMLGSEVGRSDGARVGAEDQGAQDGAGVGRLLLGPWVALVGATLGNEVQGAHVGCGVGRLVVGSDVKNSSHKTPPNDRGHRHSHWPALSPSPDWPSKASSPSTQTPPFKHGRRSHGRNCKLGVLVGCDENGAADGAADGNNDGAPDGSVDMGDEDGEAVG